MNSPKVNYTINLAGIIRNEQGTMLAVWRKDQSLLHMAEGGVIFAPDECAVEVIMENYLKSIK